MTLLVGIRCQDGVLVAADRAVTFGTIDRMTISHSACKISVVDNTLIIAGTGAVGAKQRFCETASRAWNANHAHGRTPLDMSRALAINAVQDFASTAMQGGSFGALVGFPHTQGAQLCEFAIKDFQPELKDEGSWFVSMGSGQDIADSYLAFMREVFWRQGMPTMKDALFAAAWVMRLSIKVAPGFIAEPIDIATLDNATGKARMLDDAEVQLHLSVADQATSYFGQFAPSEFAPPVEAPPPPMPEPPPDEAAKLT